MSQNDSAMADYLANNPRMVGVVFTMMLLLTQAGNAAAAAAGTVAGP
ncbi:DUF7503 family protein [Haloprofundus marisrubri]|nr:hypothetical protein [Haloprofundus marisrubri]